MSERSTSALTSFRLSAAIPQMIPGAMWMPRRLPPHVEKNVVKGHVYLSFRRGKGERVRLPDDPNSEKFKAAYAAALAGNVHREGPKKDDSGTIGALIE